MELENFILACQSQLDSLAPLLKKSYGLNTDGPIATLDPSLKSDKSKVLLELEQAQFGLQASSGFAFRACDN